jgi:hypothetical protein
VEAPNRRGWTQDLSARDQTLDQLFPGVPVFDLVREDQPERPGERAIGRRRHTPEMASVAHHQSRQDSPCSMSPATIMGGDPPSTPGGASDGSVRRLELWIEGTRGL